MSNPLASIWEDDIPVVEKPQPKVVVKKAEEKADHTEAKQIYEKYLAKIAELKPHQEYAEMVARVTGGRGQTQVEPLATMGCGGGALLCDWCKKPIVLEGGKFHNVPVDQAWASASDIQKINWVSWIKGGMAVEIIENGTLRIYHGYNRSGDCDFLDKKRRNEEESKFVRDNSKISLIWKFIDETFEISREEKNKMLSEIVSVVYGFDPGIGINKP